MQTYKIVVQQLLTLERSHDIISNISKLQIYVPANVPQIERKQESKNIKINKNIQFKSGDSAKCRKINFENKNLTLLTLQKKEVSEKFYPNK